MACNVTFSLDFDKAGCVIKAKQTKAVCDNCQPNTVNYSIQK